MNNIQKEANIFETYINKRFVKIKEVGILYIIYYLS